MVILPERSTKNSGQALLVILLILAVSLTIGLAIVSRSVMDIQISQQSEESARAFSAAEAGIESALANGALAGNFTDTGATYQVAKKDLGKDQTEFVFPGEYQTNEIQTLWLADHDLSNNLVRYYDRTKLRVVWGKPGAPVIPALEVSTYYQETGTYKVQRYALDPTTGRSVGTCPAAQCGFCDTTMGCTGISSYNCSGTVVVGGKTFRCGATLDLPTPAAPGLLLFSRLRLFYSTNEILGAKAGTGGTHDFPSQGTRIESVGQAGASTRKVEVQRLFPAPPAIFDFVLYTEGSLQK